MASWRRLGCNIEKCEHDKNFYESKKCFGSYEKDDLVI